MTRREERELVFKLLFETEFHSGIAPTCVFEESITIEGVKETPYIRDTYFGTLENLSEVDQKIGEHARKWKISRMSVVTRTLLRLAIYEMVWGGVPPKAAINESVELAKLYDEEAASAFINGILNQAARKEGLITDTVPGEEK